MKLSNLYMYIILIFNLLLYSDSHADEVNLFSNHVIKQRDKQLNVSQEKQKNNMKHRKILTVNKERGLKRYWHGLIETEIGIKYYWVDGNILDADSFAATSPQLQFLCPVDTHICTQNIELKHGDNQ